MKDPIRLDEEATGLERDVLRSDLATHPTAGDSAVVWGKLASELGLASALVSVPAAQALGSGVPPSTSAAGGAHATAPALATASSTLAFVKGVVVGVLACGVVWGGAQLLARPTLAPGRPPTVAGQSSVSVESTSQPAAVPVPSPPPATPVSPVAIVSQRAQHEAPSRPNAPTFGSAPAPSSAEFEVLNEAPRPSAQQRESELRQEALLLRQARQQLRVGDLAAASRSLEESRGRFAAPQLYQEREALTIELLFRSGQAAPAAQRARAFLQAFPGSAHSTHVKTFLGSTAP